MEELAKFRLHVLHHLQRFTRFPIILSIHRPLIDACPEMITVQQICRLVAASPRIALNCRDKLRINIIRTQSRSDLGRHNNSFRQTPTLLNISPQEPTTGGES